MLKNLKTNGSLVSNIFERIESENERFSVTSSVNMKPCTRSIFILEKFEEDFHNDAIVRYGQKFRIMANPRLIKNKKLYMTSGHVSESRFSKISR